MALSRQSRTSLICFVLGAGLLFLSILGHLSSSTHYLWETFYLFICLAYVLVAHAATFFIYKEEQNLYKNAIRALLLGNIFGFGLLISFSNTTWTHFGWYLIALSFFHWSEYYTTSVTNPRSLTLESYLLDHSFEYKIAAVASWTEFTLEWFLFPGLKQYRMISLVGLLMVIGGEVLRKASMITARSNFNHYVQHIKQHDHQLVTHGVYRYFRHPSYVGWFYWSLGTQIILCNPICLVGYTLASWRFFRQRIHEEEISLLNFFGEHYVDYQNRTGTGLPFIKGYKGRY
ncbi:hypothetical protein SNE40_013817 [Patella caerulea]|uniref:Protein-S-isoprenylcysteine O-methyltransferase n=1 Tax=Patella caerulea TaxID=87958 RepID=A0AAN8JFS5_PATCE